MNYLVANELGEVQLLIAGDASPTQEKGNIPCIYTYRNPGRNHRRPDRVTHMNFVQLDSSIRNLPSSTPNSLQSFNSQYEAPGDFTYISVGRASGLVEIFPLQLLLNTTKPNTTEYDQQYNENSSFSSGVYPDCFSLPDSVAGIHSLAPNTLLALSCKGYGAVINMSSEPTPQDPQTETLSEDLFLTSEKTVDIFDKSKTESSSKSLTLECVQEKIKTSSTPKWCNGLFRVPDPVNCSAKHSNCEHIAIGGENNLLKIFNVNSLKPVYKAKNTMHNRVSLLQEPVHVTAISFMENISNSLCITGNHSGRVYLYDYSHQRKPLLDFQATDAMSSITCLATCPIKLENLSNLTDHSQKNTPKPASSLVVSDNMGNVLLYDLRYIKKQEEKNVAAAVDSAVSLHNGQPPPAKKIRNNKNQIPHGTTMFSSQKQDQILQAKLVTTFAKFMGSTQDMQWIIEREKQASVEKHNLLAVGLGRYARIWDLTKKRKAERLISEVKMSYIFSHIRMSV